MEQNEHSLLSHKVKLQQLCRICGERALIKSRDKKKPKECGNYEKCIETVFNIDIKNDNEEIHPKTMCHRCYTSAMKFSESASSFNSKIASLSAAANECNKKWAIFNELQSASDCIVCKTFDCQKKGGRPLKPNKNRDSCEQSIFSPQSSSTPLKPSTSSQPSIDPSSILNDDYTEEEMDVDYENPASPEMTPNADIKALIDSGTSPFFERMRSLAEVEYPFTKLEEDYYTKMTRAKYRSSKDGITVRCRTGGKSFFLKKIVKSQKSSCFAASATKTKRARILRKIRDTIAGSTDEDTLAQMRTELKGTNKSAARKLFDETGVNKTEKVTARELVSLQIECGMSNTKLKVLKQVLRKKGVPICTEEEEKTFRNDADCGPIKVEKLRLYFYKDGEVTIRDTPVVTVADLPSYVVTILNKLDQHVISYTFIYIC